MPYLVQGGAEAFKQATMKKVAGVGRVKIRVSGKNLAPVIAALEHYESLLNGVDVVARQSALCTVISKCRKWLDIKRDKIAAEQDVDATVNARATRVRALMQEAWDALQATDQGATSAAFRAYDQRRQAGPYQKRGMAPGYTQEREAYLKSGKTRSVSGSLIDDLLNHGMHREFALPPQNTPARAQAVQRAADLKAAANHAARRNLRGANQQHLLESLTVSDWEKIHKVAARFDEPLETRYMPRGQRLRFLLESDGAGGLRYAVGQRSAATGNGAWPYAMDEWGNVYTAPDREPMSRAGYAMFNHSTFTAGDDVVCAGMLQIGQGGNLAYIDNNSGHYKPTVEQLRSVVTILADPNEYAVDFSQTEICDWGPRVLWPAGQVQNFRQGIAPPPPG